MLTLDRLARPPLLQPVTLTLAGGECIAIGGPSGAGKSLLLRAIADLDPNAGEVSLDEQARAALPAPEWRRRVIYVAADPGWWADDVAAHFPDRAVAGPLLTALGLPPGALDWPVERLSSGERQRLGLARALARGPRVLLLDEPTAQLDPAATERVEDLLRQHLAAGLGLMLVTHDAAQAARLAQRRFRLEGGRMVALEA
ncbi:MAG: ATP-binding cassette domain-containing protein [Candidatus Competibacterales bacterium]|nr:ATP-binding cassette domain-containing protein [Candidatus Competibacterales bacterium]